MSNVNPNIAEFASYRRRRVDARADVWVYRNLRRGDGTWYSLVQRGLVVGHCRSVIVRDARFVVRAAGRRRTLETGVKNVHAFVVGKLVPFKCVGSSDPSERVRYVPKAFSSFVDAAGSPVHAAVLVTIGGDGVFAENAS